ncbi:MAG: septum formation initiator family protein, partial [Patescibacteria group bacterium]
MTFKLTQRWAGYIVLIAVFVFAIYSNVRLAKRNYSLRKTIVANQKAVDDLKRRNNKLELLLVFYQTPEYQEVEAKRRLGLKKPGETALLVNGLPANSLAETLEDFVYREPTAAKPVQITNVQQ